MGDTEESLQRTPVIVVGTARWTAPWLTEQNLAFALADRHPVLYVEPPQIVPRRRGEDGTFRLRRVRLHGRELVIFRPVVLPLRSRAVSARATAPLYQAQLRGVVQRLGMAGAVVMVGDSRPGTVGGAGERLSSYIVKDWVYDDAGLIGRPAADLVAERDAICAAVDVVLAISPSIQESLAGVGIASEVLRHGFHADLADAYEGDAPVELMAFPGPRIVFAGRVDARLDVGKLRAVARAFPKGSVVIIGPTSPRMPPDDLAVLTGEPNIYLLGARDRGLLPPYLVHADCLLIPYRDTVWSHHGSPLKLWDYLYAGPPIVGSGYSILSDYPSFLHFANDDDEFVACVTHAVRDASGAEERRAFALANTWDARGRQLESILASRLVGDGGFGGAG
jgi:glycosyltransferase involved in cell wall biosynthesis